MSLLPHLWLFPRSNLLMYRRRSQARVIERTRVPKQRPPMFSASYLEQEEDEEPDYYGAQEREQPEDDYYRRPRDDDEVRGPLGWVLGRLWGWV